MLGGSLEDPKTYITTIEILPYSRPPVNLPVLQQALTADYPTAFVVALQGGAGALWVMAGNGWNCLYDVVSFASLSCLPKPPSNVYESDTMRAILLPIVASANNVYPLATVFLCQNSAANFDVNCFTSQPGLGASATWTTVSMPSGRYMSDMILLPDQTVLILNGVTRGYAGFRYASTAILTAFLYNPKTNTFAVLASSTIQRFYHSNAVLTVDGRVLITGSTPNGNSNLDFSQTVHPIERRMEFYLPPYLSTPASAPNIVSVSSSQWAWNQLYTITATIPSQIQSNVVVNLINPGFVTHNQPMGSNFLVLSIESITVSGSTMTIVVYAPPNNILAPPANYQLWVVDGEKPCSRAQWVAVGTSSVNFPNVV